MFGTVRNTPLQWLPKNGRWVDPLKVQRKDSNHQSQKIGQ